LFFVTFYSLISPHMTQNVLVYAT